MRLSSNILHLFVGTLLLCPQLVSSRRAVAKHNHWFSSISARLQGGGGEGIIPPPPPLLQPRTETATARKSIPFKNPYAWGLDQPPASTGNDPLPSSQSSNAKGQ